MEGNKTYPNEMGIYVRTGVTWFGRGNSAGILYRGADKSLARPGRKPATTTEDFDVHISYL